MKYAITGNKGLIGQKLKKELDRRGNDCVLSIDKREGFDVMDLMFKGYELSEKPDAFYHFAAQCRINEAIENPLLPHRNNVDGILSVLEFCKTNDIPKLVVASSSRVLSPERNPYVASKVYVEEMTKAYHDCYGLEYIIVRPSTVYGPAMDETSRLINNFLTSAFKDDELRIYGDESKTLDFTYVDDFIDGVMLAERKWNNSYNISGNNEVNLTYLAKEIIKQTGSKSKIVYLPPEKAQPQQVKVDTSEIEKLGYSPQVPIEEGVKRMIDWYDANPEAIEKYQDKGRIFYKNGK